MCKTFMTEQSFIYLFELSIQSLGSSVTYVRFSVTSFNFAEASFLWIANCSFLFTQS